MGAPSSLCFSHAVHNMVTAGYCLEDISDMLDLKNKEWLNEAKRLLRIALNQ